jgi:leader peptidase (prepilin peptidase)/N-methyltransferase
MGADSTYRQPNADPSPEADGQRSRPTEGAGLEGSAASRNRSRVKVVACAMCCTALVTPLLRWAIVSHSVSARRAWRRACPRCSTRLGPGGDVVSLTPKAQCGICGQRLGPPPWTVEFVFAASLALLVVAGMRDSTLVAFGWWAAIGTVLMFVDLAVQRLPARLCYLAVGGQGVVLLGQAVATDMWGPWLRLVLGALGSAALIAACSLAAPATVRWGDVRFALAVGGAAAWVGWLALYATAMLAMLMAAVAGIGLIAARRATLRSHLPQGPFWYSAALIVIVLAAV